MNENYAGSDIVPYPPPGNYEISLDYYTDSKNNYANGAHYRPG